jgi:thiamine kinase-like enzyme
MRSGGLEGRNIGAVLANLKIPYSIEAIRPEWLTQALRGKGIITKATVKSLSMGMLEKGWGFTSQIVRIIPDYDVHEEGAPRSLIAKIHSADPDLRALLNRRRLYEREIRFYEEIANEINLRTPRCYYSSLNIETGESILLLEDLSHARLGDHIMGCSSEEAELIVRHMAKLHATWWESPRLENTGWVPSFDEGAGSEQGFYQRSWDQVTEKIRDQSPASFLELGTRFGNHVANVRNQLGRPPRTLIHGDCRLDNIFFSSPESGVSFIIIDWQLAMRGRGVYDIVYFLVYCLPPEQRRAIERGLLKIYHSVLVEGGVRGYEFDQCLHDYRLCTLHMFHRLMMAGVVIDFSSERGRALMNTILQRCIAAMDDHNVSGLIPE